MNGPPGEQALLSELGQAMKAARKQAGLVQRELAHKIGYSRTSIANAEAGVTCLSRDFYQRVDTVLGTNLAHGHSVIRVLRAERAHANAPGTVPDEFTERCEEVVRATALRVPGHAEIQADVGGSWRKAISLPDQSLKIVVEIHVVGDQ